MTSLFRFLQVNFIFRLVLGSMILYSPPFSDSLHWFCHSWLICLLMRVLTSSYVIDCRISMSFPSVAAFAASWACSFPRMPTCPGIQTMLTPTDPVCCIWYAILRISLITCVDFLDVLASSVFTTSSESLNIVTSPHSPSPSIYLRASSMAQASAVELTFSFARWRYSDLAQNFLITDLSLMHA